MHVFACLRQCNAVFCASGVKSTSTSSTIGARSIRSVRHRPQVAHLKQGAWRRTQALNLLLLKMQQFCGFLRSFSDVLPQKAPALSASAPAVIRSSWAALPVNCRCASNACAPAGQRFTVHLTRSAAGTQRCILRQTGVRQAFSSLMFGLLAKSFSGFRSLSAEEIRDNGTQQCHQRGDAQPVRSKRTFSSH